MSLWPAEASPPTPSVVVGTAPVLASKPAEARRLFAQARQSGQLVLTNLLPGAVPRLGYAFAVPSSHGGYIAYAENPLPANGRSQLAESTGFGDLNYALYLGRSQNAKARLVTNMTHFPITGRKASTVVPFGKGAFTLVVTPARSLGGSFFEDLPWLIALVGALVSMAAAVMTERIVRRRADAERLAVCPRPRGEREPPDVHPAAGDRPDAPARVAARGLPDSCPGSRSAPATCRPPPGSTWAGTGTTWCRPRMEAPCC